MLTSLVGGKLAQWGLVAALVALPLAWWVGLDAGRDSRAEEVAALGAVGAEQSRRARAQSQEVADAQKAHVSAWVAVRRDADAAWVQHDKARRGRVPSLCAEPGSAPADSAGTVARDSGQGGADVDQAGAALEAISQAARAGEAMQATLELCQAELRMCASLR